MKKIQVFLIVFTLMLSFSCKENKSKTENEAESIKVESKKENQEPKTQGYVPKKQTNVKIETADNYIRKHLLKDGENYFKMNSDLIRVVIPNTDENMKIVDVINISDYNNNKDYNAIVIHITNGLDTGTEDNVSYKLKADLKISKITGLKRDKLKNKNLKVYVINEDILDKNELAFFKNCASLETNYSHLECNLNDGKLYEQDDNAITILKDDLWRPREQEGDIIPGGN